MADLSPEVLVIDELAGGEIAPVAGPAWPATRYCLSRAGSTSLQIENNYKNALFSEPEPSFLWTISF